MIKHTILRPYAWPPASLDPGAAPTFSSAQPTSILANTPTTEKEQEQPTPTIVVDVESKEVAEVA